MPNLEIELEFGAFDGAKSQDPCPDLVIREIQRLQRKISLEVQGVTLKFIPYEGDPGLLCGGRTSAPTLQQTLQAIKTFNTAGIPFMVAMNGGLGLPADIEIDIKDPKFHTEERILTSLQVIGEEHGVNNLVTITHARLLDTIRKRFPNVRVIKSCIGFVGGRKGHFKGEKEYDNAFRDFDGVVPLNQHTTPAFLARWREYATKMVVLLNSHCDCPNLHQCFQHYQDYEAAALFSALGVHDTSVSLKDFGSISNPEFPYAPGCSKNNMGELLYRDNHIAELVRLGVRRFKMGRDSDYNPLDEDFIFEFLRKCINAVN